MSDDPMLFSQENEKEGSVWWLTLCFDLGIVAVYSTKSPMIYRYAETAFGRLDSVWSPVD